MTTAEWGILAGVVMSALLALAPWMFMVHAKLAVLATRMEGLEGKVDKLIETNDQRLPTCVQHAARLDTHELQIAQIDERLREAE